MNWIFSKRRTIILVLFLLGYVLLWPMAYSAIPLLNTTSNRLHVQMTVGLVCIFLYYGGKIKGKKADYIRERMQGKVGKMLVKILGLIILSAFIAYLLWFVQAFVCLSTHEFLTQKGITAESLSPTSDLQQLYFLGATIVGPISEEIVYRKLLYGVVRNSLRGRSPVISTVLVAFVFALSHFIGLIPASGSLWVFVLALNYMIPGILFQNLANRTDNLALPTLVHMFYNALCIIL